MHACRQTDRHPDEQTGIHLALRALSSLRGLRGAPEVPPLCRETQSLGQQMLNAPLGINGLMLNDLAMYLRNAFNTIGRLFAPQVFKSLFIL